MFVKRIYLTCGIVASAVGVAKLCAIYGLVTATTVNIQQPLDYRVRAWLKQDPDIDSKIKIFTFDDRAVQVLGRPTINSDEWVAIFNRLAQRRPRAVLVDKIFAPTGGSESEVEQLAKSIASLPTFAGAAGYDVAIPWRISIDGRKNIAALPVRKTDLLTVPQKFIYGPNPNLIDAFRGIGHINGAKLGTVEKHLISHSGQRVASLALAPFITDTTVQRLPQKLTVNYPSLSQLYKQSYSLAGILNTDKKLRIKGNINKVVPDDIVIILPEFYTGNADMIETPLGRIPSGLILVSIVNSVLQRDFIKDLQPFVLCFTFAVALALSVSSYLLVRLRYFLALLISFIAMLTIAGSAIFAFASVQIPYLFLVVVCLVVGIVLTSIELHQYNIWKALMGRGFIGNIDAADKFIETAKKLRHQPMRFKSVIMFVDVVGFSKFCDEHPVDIAFAKLSRCMRMIGEIVRQHGGVVDRSIGDGCLAFFGVNLADKAQLPPKEIVTSAMSCAQRIQEIFGVQVGRGLRLRIGLHYGDIIVGDLGDTSHLDITAISSDVNFAKRIESSVIEGRVGYSMEYGKLLPPQLQSIQKYITVKHDSEVRTMWEAIGSTESLIDLASFCNEQQRTVDALHSGIKAMESSFGQIGIIWTGGDVFYAVARSYPQAGMTFYIRGNVKTSESDERPSFFVRTSAQALCSHEMDAIFAITLLSSDDSVRKSLVDTLAFAKGYLADNVA